MQELDKLNPRPGTATDSMALLLAINTSSLTPLPTGVNALMAAPGSAAPAGILPTAGTNRPCVPRTLTLAVPFGNLPSVLCADTTPTNKREGWTERECSKVLRGSTDLEHYPGCFKKSRKRNSSTGSTACLLVRHASGESARREEE
jgi:hypothetical protein